MSLAAQAHTDPAAARLPSHIAIIMDGNGRWAKEQGVSRVRGHNAGANALRGLIESCRTRPFIKYLTLYAFSTENWNRPPEEVGDLMDLLRFYIKREAPAMLEQGVHLRFIGQRWRLPEDIQKDLLDVEKMMTGAPRLTVNMAISYGARQELVQAMKEIAQKVEVGVLTPQEINEALIEQHLTTTGIPDPDLLIRTGGDERLSNFLLWQSAYTELYFVETLWPDFLPEHLDEAINAFQKRDRRFGSRKE